MGIKGVPKTMMDMSTVRRLKERNGKFFVEVNYCCLTAQYFNSELIIIIKTDKSAQ